jgi:hypothetical protein
MRIPLTTALIWGSSSMISTPADCAVVRGEGDPNHDARFKTEVDVPLTFGQVDSTSLRSSLRGEHEGLAAAVAPNVVYWYMGGSLSWR